MVLARNKPLGKKLRLAHAGHLSRSVPAWIIAKTHGGVRASHKKRKWRVQHIKP